MRNAFSACSDVRSSCYYTWHNAYHSNRTSVILGGEMQGMNISCLELPLILNTLPAGHGDIPLMAHAVVFIVFCFSVLGMAQDDFIPPGLPLLSPVVPEDVYISDSCNPETAFNSHLEEVKETSGDFSSVDLSFLPDELTQENKDQTVIRSKHEIEENCKTQSLQRRLPLSSQQDVGLGLHSSSSSESHAPLPPGGANSAPPSEKPNSLSLASITPMTPMTPLSECSGIVPQLQ